jgi:3D (Asp-Asp-Asp) domain-containing protein
VYNFVQKPSGAALPARRRFFVASLLVFLTAAFLLPLGAVAGALSPTLSGQSATNGRVIALGDAAAHGDLTRPVDRVVALATTPSGAGYWLGAADGGVFAFGDARFFGSMGGQRLSAPIVGMAATPTGAGYWLVGADGGVFAFGDAVFLGSLSGRPLSAPIVGMAASPTGQGYWFAGGDGGVFAFGDAAFYGSTGGEHLNATISAISASPTGQGYWLAGADGGVFAFGDASYAGSMGGRGLAAPIVAMAASPSGRGYWLAGADGGVFSFGDATFHGSATAGTSAAVVAIRPSADGGGYLLATGQARLLLPPLTPLGLFSATCYDLPGHTASGLPVSTSAIAVDPRVIPLGTRLVVEGVGLRIAEDTGGGIKGFRIDVWEPSLGACMAFGVRPLHVWRIG